METSPNLRPTCTDRSFDDAAAAQMERIIADLGVMYQERNRALREVANAHHETLLRLALAAELRDDDTGVHIIRIGHLAEALALKCGEAPRFAQMLRHAASMHDVGKIGVPDRVLKKPGTYTQEEREVMKRHPVIGAQILGRSRIPLFQLAAEVAMSHHERWDGTGYPLGLAREAIPIFGRIVAVVDFFDALTMDRCYRKAYADNVALSMLAEQSGAAFDPRLVEQLLSNATEFIALRNRITDHPPSFEFLAEAA